MFFHLAILATTVAIVGGGVGGLVSTKEAKECGLQPTLFEQGSTLGGVWGPKEGKTWDSMQINNSRNGCTFSDFAWEDSATDFPNQREVYDYLCSYVKAHGIEEHVHLKSKVTKIERKNEQWCVEWSCEGEVHTALFDSVIICSGINAKGYIPEITGQATFRGSVMHAKDYKNPHSLINKRVAVIGNAFSGCEIAAEVAQIAEKVIHVYLSPNWVQSRYLKEQNSHRKMPYDLSLIRRSSISQYIDLPLVERFKQGTQTYNNLCHWQKTNFPETVPVVTDAPLYIAISDTYLSEIQKKKIELKQNPIKSIGEKGLYFEDNSSVQVDSIIYCTGYHSDLSFLNSEIIEKIEYKPEDTLQPIILYKNVFHPDLPHLAFVGIGRFGINFPISELQARWACMVFSGKIPLPANDVMKEGLKCEQAIRARNPRPQFARSALTLCDELADQIGVLPDFNLLKKENPHLYKKLWEGPFTSASYRLVGFGKNPVFASKEIDALCEQAGDPLQNPECFYKNLSE